MKKASTSRSLAILPCFSATSLFEARHVSFATLDTLPHIVVTRISVSEEKIHYKAPNTRARNDYPRCQHWKKMPKVPCCKKQPSCELSLVDISHNNIFTRNVWIVSNTIAKRLSDWSSYLRSLFCLIHQLELQLKHEPDPKLSIILKHLKRSYRDSFEAYQLHGKPSLNTILFVPKSRPLPIPYSLIEDELGNIDFDEAIDPRSSYKHRSKKSTKYRKRARRNKMAERNFWLNENFKGHPYVEADSAKNPFDEESEIVKVTAELYDAEDELKSSCFAEARWAIFYGLNKEYAETIHKASKIYGRYRIARKRYEEVMATQKA